ncbi:uncharacterized protein LOC129909637 [Episyrphus balteatus]|uniref:uncharacterized protein LOC129909637 n=1 Tax=Episyrphus balteatus TaxID=286459 RepID=UPI0024855408|nr:uncharacterized protein LOC129909637 [Episyrphus balteatus]
MAQDQIKTLKMMYNDQLEYIDCPWNANYEKCIEIALKRFEIPSKFKKSIQIYNDFDEIFEKHTFEYYNFLFPSPATIFSLKIDEEEIKNQQPGEEKREPLDKLTNKRKRRCNENHGVPVTRQNCFFGSLLGFGTESSEEPISKKHKLSSINKTKELGVLTRTVSRRLIRI